MYRKFYGWFTKLENGIEWLEKNLYLILLTVLVGTIFFQVIGRYFLGLATPWAEELARYSFVWISWIVGAYSLKYGGHIVMNLIDTKLDKAKDPKKAYFIMSKITYSVVIVFMLEVLHQFYLYFMKAFNGSRTAAATGIPMWIIFLGVLAGMILMIIQSLYVLLAPFDREPDEAKEEEQT